jgi:N-carbamoyl-L-amino-acid hydrolase
VDGISHNEHEYTTDEDIVAGLTMLTEVANRLCNGDLQPAATEGKVTP